MTERTPHSTPEVPPLLHQKAAELGPRGQQWLDELGARITEFAHRWSFTVREPLGGGSAAYVARVTTTHGLDAVLKLPLPDADAPGEPRTLAAAKGRGYAHLFAHDPERHALLLESLGPSLDALDVGPERSMRVLCRTLREAWRTPVPADLRASQEGDAERDKAEQLGGMVTRLWEELNHPCPIRVVDQARRYADRRAAAYDAERSVVVHGDPHPSNVLRVNSPRPGADSGFVFVDPDGFLAEPAYDLGVVLRDWCPQLLAGEPREVAARYCRLLASTTAVDSDAIWEWGYLERVSTGLYLLSLGEEKLAHPFLTTADRLA